MKKTYKIYMVLENGQEVYLEKFSKKEQAELRCARYTRQDEYERQIGYHTPNTKYIIK